jgi:hypothetical protein
MVVVADLLVPAAVFGSEVYLFRRPQAVGGLRLPPGFVAMIGGWVTFAAGLAVFWILVFRQQHQVVAGQQELQRDHTIGA